MKTILVVENEPIVADVLRRILEEQYDVMEASSAQQAIRLFSDHEGRIDLLIADLNLPTSSGLQVALLLRVQNECLPVMLTSGYPVSCWSEGDYADMERLGSKSVVFLQKPIQPGVLLDAVGGLIGAPVTGRASTT